MEKSYKNIVYFFLGVTAIVLTGFSYTYFRFFPSFPTHKTLHHVHAVVLLLWIALLIVQPILISKKRYDLHHTLGKLSYFLVPIMVTTMLLAYRSQYFRFDGQITRETNLGFMFLPFTDVLPFTTFYILAMMNTQNIAKHMRYIIATAIVVFGPGLVRTLDIFLDIEVATLFNLANGITACLFPAFIIFDQIKGRSPMKNPMTTAFIIFAVPNFLYFIVPQTKWWQEAAARIVDVM